MLIWAKNDDKPEQLVWRHWGGSSLGLWLEHRKGENSRKPGWNNRQKPYYKGPCRLWQELEGFKLGHDCSGCWMDCRESSGSRLVHRLLQQSRRDIWLWLVVVAKVMTVGIRMYVSKVLDKQLVRRVGKAGILKFKCLSKW